MLRRSTAVGMALCHVVLVSGATALHRHGPELSGGLRLSDLPAEYHHHDFRFVGGGEEPTPAHDDCIGCRLERSVALPLPPASTPPAGVAGPCSVDLPVAAPSPERFDDRLPRAPPLA
ncbi:MAG TPA: hypothetical protein VFP76_03905 [Gemmatimonadota bacterium]|nr:hypothetical protein [Gemmatimonadota bacterium]